MAKTDPTRSTLATVAGAAGVSVATVSKVVNGRRDVSPETRARVRAVLLDQGYVARGPGGVLARERTIELVFDAFRTPNNLEILRGVVERCADHGVVVVVGTVPDDPLGVSWARRLVAAQREGLILVTTPLSMQQRRQFARAGIPLATIDLVNDTAPDVVGVGSANFAGGLSATRHLVELGHTRIAMIEGPPETVVSVARLHGYYAAFASAGIAVQPRLVRAGEFTFESGFAATMALLALEDRPTAIFASNDLQALGALEAARASGLRVPADLSVVGFDDMPAASWSAPPLTTVRQPFADMGREAARLLLGLIAHEPPRGSRLELATELVVRQSTAAPPRS